MKKPLLFFLFILFSLSGYAQIDKGRTIDFQSKTTKFSISPNPATKNLNISIVYYANRDYNLEVYDVLGKQIYRGQITKGDTSIDVRNWRQGVYLVKLSNNQFTQTKRFIKQ